MDSRKVWFSGKEKFLVAAVSKESQAVFLDMKGLITIEKGETVNIASYCQYLGQNLSYLLNDPRK